MLGHSSSSILLQVNQYVVKYSPLTWVGIKLLLNCPYDHFLHVKYEAVNRVYVFPVSDIQRQHYPLVGRNIWGLRCLSAVPDAAFDLLPDLFTAQYFSS